LDHHPGSTISLYDERWQTQTGDFVPTYRRNIAYVFQEPRLFPHCNVEKNLQYALRRRSEISRRLKQPGPELQQVIDWCGIKPLLKQTPQTLSGGQKQRVAIARALLSAPKLLLMDEPLGALDNKSRDEILPFLEQLFPKFGIPMIYVSHNIKEISHLADDLVLLENGRVIAEGPLIELCSQLDLPLAQAADSATIMECEVHDFDENYQITTALLDAQHKLQLASPKMAAGSLLRVRIPASDVSITLSKADDSSILNIIAATVDAIEPLNEVRVLVRLKIGTQHLLAHITGKSATRLNLHPGQAVYAQIKTVALINEAVLHGLSQASAS